MPPRYIRRFGSVSLEAGSANTAEVANDSAITAYIQSVNFVNHPALNVIRIPGPFANYPVPGRITDAEYDVVMHGTLAAFMAAWGSKQTIEVIQPVHSPGRGAADQKSLTTEYVGWLSMPDPGALDFSQDQPRLFTARYQLIRYHMNLSGVTAALWDIDLDSDTHQANGVDIFTRQVIP